MDPNLGVWPPCPHCRQEMTDGVSHFASSLEAIARGTVLCNRAGTRIARMDYWGWACPPGHTCYAGPLPAVPERQE